MKFGRSALQTDHSNPIIATVRFHPLPLSIHANNHNRTKANTKTGSSLGITRTFARTATHPEPMVSAAVLTVSDTASADSLLDVSGPTAADFLKGRGHRVLHTEIVPDDTELIRHSITAWAANRPHPIDLIITTGGTGFGARDVTPEVLNPVLSVLGI